MRCRRIQLLAFCVLLVTDQAEATTQHPACEGKDNRVCETMAVMINARGRGCFRMMSVQPIDANAYRVTCELAPDDRSMVTYEVKFRNGRRNYVVR